ncbi:MAG: DUF86 domain-containing protein [candidate division Zixibacteria bacterium]|nr:DUF86 domain-containing protein [Candidatus Tariuqbacter arcticus]
MFRDFSIYFKDILESIKRIQNYVEGMDFNSFKNDSKTIDAVLRNFEVIGMAVNKVPDNTKANYPQVEWSEIKAFRNVIVHEYFSIYLETVWEVIQNDLPVLEQQVKSMLNDLD